MDENAIKIAFDPFFTTKTTRQVGLGVPLLAQTVRERNWNIVMCLQYHGKMKRQRQR